MVKNLRFIMMSMLAMLCGTAMAGSITFGELGLENGVQYSDPFDGGDFTVTFAGGTNDGKYYNTGTGIRVYGNGTMTIAAKSGTLTKIAITYDGTNKPESADVVSAGTYDPETGIWTGDAESVVFTRPSGTGHWRVKSIKTGSDVVEPDKPTEGQTPETALTISRALELIDELGEGKSTDFTYYVKGVVTSVKTVTTSGASFFIGETATAENTVQTYNLKGLENKTITNTDFVKAGDEVVVFGTLMKYKNNNTNEIVPEVTSGYVYSVNGKTQDDTPNPEDAIQGGTEDNPLTVDQALAYINGFSNGFITTKQYYVKGTVTEVEEISTANGNATFVMNGLKAYRVKGLENKNITEEEYVKANDEVIVLAKLQKYVKGDDVTPELSSGYIYSLNGKTQDEEKPIVLEGDGSQENPYTVADLKAMPVPTATSAEESQEKVWVKGVIVGSLNSSGNAILEGDQIVASNIGLAAAAGETDGKNCVPVQLPTGDLRASLNVLDNANNVGKEVLVYGHILKYMSRTGVKNVTDYILDGVQFSAGIATITADQQQASVYNLAGQRVENAQKGLYIIGGKKVIK